ncbi:uncharacterized protein LOC9644262 [Selaginella moellendorffii]|nr:uncharacterized protein LOC9644262 [Selaginella moellendorffii]|eukprot:XP_002984414.2 uncharacterized protein LOC9644262 [Selaginella moellendorffii]
MGALSGRTLVLAGTRAWFFANSSKNGGLRVPAFFRLGFVICILLLAVVLLILVSAEWNQSWKSSQKARAAAALSAEFGVLGVPWCKAKEGSAVPWTREELVQGLQEFVPVYKKRPIKNNAFGMGFDHSFGLWFLARQVKPLLLIESGAFKGHSTWVMRQARPETPIISISPRHPEKYLKKGPAYVDRNTRYFAGKQFVDFGSVKWNKVLEEAGVQDRSRILVFFDDHQSQLKRIKQARDAGFQHLVFEDNYDTGTGDHYSLRQICDQLHIEGGGHNCDPESEEARTRQYRSKKWEKAMDSSQLCGGGGEWWGVRGEMRDNFNHSNAPISHQQHLHNGRLVESMLQLYWELPPVAGPSLTKQNRYDPARSSRPLVGDGDRTLFRKLGLHSLEKRVFNGYTQMAYVRLLSSS